MTRRLLDRQRDLLIFLTSGPAIFGGAGPADERFTAADHARLRLEARFSHEKRMQKIAAAFPRTLARLGRAAPAIIRAFAEACPPEGISRLDNARQFHAFLAQRWRRAPPKPAWLADLMACEFACLRARMDGFESAAGAGGVRGAVRRRRNVVLLRCGHDVRPLFDGSGGRVRARATVLAVGMPPGFDEPQVFELAPAVFDLLAALDDWTEVSDLREAPAIGALVRELADGGLVEVCR